jgi:hypothetical protein
MAFPVGDWVDSTNVPVYGVYMYRHCSKVFGIRYMPTFLSAGRIPRPSFLQ